METREHPIRIEVADAVAGTGDIEGDLRLPPDPCGLVIFAHGSGSSRHSARNRMVASVLNAAGFATLLFDLLTAAEERVDDRTREFRFDIGLLSDRPVAACDLVAGRPDTADLPIGMFGASTGRRRRSSRRRLGLPWSARWSRGAAVPTSRATPCRRFAAPTLLIVGSRDPQVIELNEEAAARMTCQTRDRDRARRHASVRGAGNARGGRAARGGMVRAVRIGGDVVPGASAPATEARALRRGRHLVALARELMQGLDRRPGLRPVEEAVAERRVVPRRGRGEGGLLRRSIDPHDRLTVGTRCLARNRPRLRSLSARRSRNGARTT